MRIMATDAATVTEPATATVTVEPPTIVLPQRPFSAAPAFWAFRVACPAARKAQRRATSAVARYEDAAAATTLLARSAASLVG